ncbi:hypothetical protein GCM10010503_04940 [Streptomyces lucensis JCM 4490]|uniref:Uncharacterized protein n=1 Tax=Streptomyces lucensis JCM 4490 TaxID=1306176 RepID=A0A918IU38_9ACTN|nr:hypothetical protein [Streptomyces lucensis]GGW32194.1 hypothetical protein GCM10010503_04940 [Streptomyces lucensis JCM 4490]
MEHTTHADPHGDQGALGDVEAQQQPEFIQVRLLDKIETIQNKQIDS